MRKVKYFLIILLLTVNCSFLIAQTQPSTKAFKYYQEAKDRIDRKEYAEAEKVLKKAIKSDEKFVEAYLMLGDVNYYQEYYKLAIVNYKKATEIEPDKYPRTYYIIGNIHYSLAEYEEAEQNYKKYLQYPGIEQENITKAERYLKNCVFAIEAIKHPVSFDPKNLGAEVNSTLNEYFPCLTVDGKTLLYTRLIEDNKSKDGWNEDFFVSHNENGKWSQCENIGKPINTSYNEGAPSLSPDGQILIFTACEIFGDYGPGRNGYGSCDLFFSIRFGNNWTNPVNMGPPINSKNWETQPSYSSDGKTIYFVRASMEKNRRKNQDIYMAEIGDDGKWKNPVKLNDKINTPGREESVFIHPDNQTLYFSSDGHAGMGGLDIYVSHRDKNGEWGEPVNLGYPINTIKDENSFTVSGDGKTAFFSSDRPGGFGGMDLYSFDLPEQFRPLQVSYMKGKVADKETKKPVYARFELIDLETGRTAVKSFSNRGNGEFLVCLPVNKDYALNVSADGYLFYSENFKFKKSDSVNSAFSIKHSALNKDVLLSPIKVGETVVLKNIFFETAKYDLLPESQTELNKLIDLLAKNSKMKIEISGHTDNIGKETDNQILSENRAKAVYDYLASHNISPERMTYKGYGDTKPIDTNDTEQGRANNRRTEFKVIENKI